MPDYFWAINRTGVMGTSDISEATASVSAFDVEVRATNDGTITRLQVLEALEKLEAYIMSEESWPPA